MSEKTSEIPSKFITIAAHQLRTPATGIKWALGMILSGKDPLTADQKDLLDQSFESINQIIEIINDLLNISKLGDEDASYDYKNVDLVPIINQVLEDTLLRVKERKIAISFSNETGEEGAIVNADMARIHMVILNLIDNAIRYSYTGGTIAIHLAKKENAALFSICDTGIGIPVEERHKIFTQFFRASNAISAQPNGTGIGLYINQIIVEKHKGAIWFDTEEGKGSTFYVKLPLK